MPGLRSFALRKSENKIKRKEFLLIFIFNFKRKTTTEKNKTEFRLTSVYNYW